MLTFILQVEGLHLLFGVHAFWPVAQALKSHDLSWPGRQFTGGRSPGLCFVLLVSAQ